MRIQSRGCIRVAWALWGTGDAGKGGTAGRRVKAGESSGGRNSSRGDSAITMNEKIRILVAEDHLVARVGVSTIVNMQADMEVVAEAANGQQAVEMFRQYLPDVTLLDLRMPVMGGVEAAIAIKAQYADAHL